MLGSDHASGVARLLRAAAVCALGLIAPAATASAAVDYLDVQTPEFALGADQCFGGDPWTATFVTKLTSSRPTADGDGDVNVGAWVRSTLLGRDSSVAAFPGIDVVFDHDGERGNSPTFPFTFGPELAPMRTTEWVTLQPGDAGRVHDYSLIVVNATRAGAPTLQCTPSGGESDLSLYVNKPPAAVADKASTDNVTPVVVDVLSNDDATWDSGRISSGHPTPDEVASQDDLLKIPPADRADAVAISFDPAHGAATVGSDGRVTYTPEGGFVGSDSFDYSVTDNDGATSWSEVAVNVAAPKVDSIKLSASATEVDQGGSVTLTATGFSAGGDDLGDVTDQVVFTSDVDTDKVRGNTVTFPTASPHTITGRHTATGSTASVLIQVKPAPSSAPPPPAPDRTDALPDTGGSSAGVLAGGVLALLAGAGLILFRRKA